MSNLPRWALVTASTIGVLAIGGIGTWAGAQLHEAAAVNADQTRTLAVHEYRLDDHDKTNSRIEGKLDRILEKLESRP